MQTLPETVVEMSILPAMLTRREDSLRQDDSPPGDSLPDRTEDESDGEESLSLLSLVIAPEGTAALEPGLNF